MHYKDGTQAQIGDIARGKGSNHRYTVQGVIVGLTAGATACNLKLLLTEPKWFNDKPTEANPSDVTHIEQVAIGADGQLVGVGTTIEYGTVGDFELVHRPIRGANGSWSR